MSSGRDPLDGLRWSPCCGLGQMAPAAPCSGWGSAPQRKTVPTIGCNRADAGLPSQPRCCQQACPPHCSAAHQRIINRYFQSALDGTGASAWCCEPAASCGGRPWRSPWKAQSGRQSRRAQRMRFSEKSWGRSAEQKVRAWLGPGQQATGVRRRTARVRGLAQRAGAKLAEVGALTGSFKMATTLHSIYVASGGQISVRNHPFSSGFLSTRLAVITLARKRRARSL